MKKSLVLQFSILCFLTSLSIHAAAQISRDPACGDPDQPPHNIWVFLATQTFPCANLCPDGKTRLQCTQDSEKEMRCIEGYSNPTGNSRMIGTPKPMGECPAVVKDCGQHKSGTTWYEVTGAVSRVCEMCADGTTNHLCDKNQETEKSCNNGVVSATGNVRDGAFIQYTNTCPVIPKDCGQHKSGTTWWEVSGRVSRVCEMCTDGTNHLCDKNQETEKSCTDGAVAVTGNVRDGAFIEYTNQCVPTDPVCGDPGQPTHSVWVTLGLQTFPCPDLCPDGKTRLQCQQMAEKELSCTAGHPSETGNSRMVGQPEKIGTCPVMPKDCGQHANGTKWFDVTGTVSRVCDICEDGSNHTCTKKQESEKSCADGVVSATGVVRDGEFVEYTNVCLPPPPKACGDHASGTNWWEEVSTSTQACQSCWDGSTLNCKYAVEGVKLCTNGTISDGQGTRQGRLIETIGQCPRQPRDCGNLKNGQTDWRVNGQGAPYDCEVCIDGSTRKCVKEKQEQVRCDDGILNLTGLIRDGQFIGYLNNCPTNIVEKTESVTVSANGGKADVLFIIDTTPSMFLSLKNLALKYDKLISSWKNIDWQIGITNSKVENTLFDGHVMKGEIMELQKNDETKKVEYILKPGYFAYDWFYRTMSRDPSDDGCNSQPYCMTEVSEPLRALKGAIDLRDKGHNKGFFREKAKLVVVMISSSDERSVGAADKKSTKPEDAIKYFNQKLGSRMDGMIGMSVVIKPGDAACLKHYRNIFDLGLGGEYGKSLSDFATQTGGITASICDKDYGSSLSKLSESVRQLVESITLKDTPMPGSLQITFTPQSNATWVLQGNKVIFDRPIPKGTKIDIRYLVKTN